GVQTCALPISFPRLVSVLELRLPPAVRWWNGQDGSVDTSRSTPSLCLFGSKRVQYRSLGGRRAAREYIHDLGAALTFSRRWTRSGRRDRTGRGGRHG